MHRILVSSPLIGSYSFCLVAAFLAAYLLARANARRIGMEPRHVDNVSLLLGVAGLGGARIFSWLFYFPPGFTLWQALIQPGGGMVFYGGVIVGIIVVIGYARVMRTRLLDLIDVLAGPLALGLAIGRIGCFLAGCCWGDVCVDAKQFPALSDAHLRYQVQTIPWFSNHGFPLAVRFPVDCGALNQHQELGLLPASAVESLPVHPVQLYEAALAFLLACWLQPRLRDRRHAGQVFAAFCAAYGTIRFGMEFLRGDNLPAYFGLTLSQVISLFALIAVGALAAIARLQLLQSCMARTLRNLEA